MLVHQISFAEALAAVLAVVDVSAGEVYVLNVLVGSAPVLQSGPVVRVRKTNIISVPNPESTPNLASSYFTGTFIFAFFVSSIFTKLATVSLNAVFELYPNATDMPENRLGSAALPGKSWRRDGNGSGTVRLQDRIAPHAERNWTGAALRGK